MTTERHREAMRFVLGRLATDGKVPSTRQIRSGMCMSSMATAQRVRRGLFERGLIVSEVPPVVSAKAFKVFSFTPEGGMRRVF